MKSKVSPFERHGETNTTTTPPESSPPTPPAGYKRADLDLLNLLQHPVWIFDAQRTQMFWANRAALRLWNAPNLQELLGRDYATDMTVATRQRIEGLLRQMEDGDVVQEQWTYYPHGVPQTVNVTASLVWIVDDDNDDPHAAPRPAIMDEAEPVQTAFHASATRDIELLRHVPIAVSQFGMNGQLLYQNPQDIHTFGCQSLSYDDDDKSIQQQTSKDATRGVGDGSNNGRSSTSGNSDKENAVVDCTGADDNSSNHNHNTFVDRFVDRELGESVLRRVAEGQEVNVQAEMYGASPGDEEQKGQDHAIEKDAALDPACSLPTRQKQRRAPRHFAVSVRRTKDPSSGNNERENKFVILYTARDVTEIVQARKDQDKIKLKAEFLSVIAHELRTPLHQGT